MLQSFFYQSFVLPVDIFILFKVVIIIFLPFQSSQQSSVWSIILRHVKALQGSEMSSILMLSLHNVQKRVILPALLYVYPHGLFPKLLGGFILNFILRQNLVGMFNSDLYWINVLPIYLKPKLKITYFLKNNLLYR
jgi:hypothetical protein